MGREVLLPKPEISGWLCYGKVPSGDGLLYSNRKEVQDWQLHDLGICVYPREKWNGPIHQPVFTEGLLSADHSFPGSGGRYTWATPSLPNSRSKGGTVTNEETAIMERGRCIGGAMETEGYLIQGAGRGVGTLKWFLKDR